MTIKEIFQPFFEIHEAKSSFSEFCGLLESTQPDFNESTEWDQLDEQFKAGIILQLSIIAGFRVSAISEYMRHEIQMDSFKIK